MAPISTVASASWSERLPPWLDRLAALIARGWEAADGAGDDAEFEELALAIHAWQAERIPAVAALALRRASSWREVPAVPVGLFARHDIFAWPAADATGCFLSSGTTRAARGRHFHRDLALYRAACLAGARWALDDPKGRWRVESFQPDDGSSSLATMIRFLAEDLGDVRDSSPPGYESPVLAIGPAFAFVPLIDAEERRPLPPGSAVVETGGMKGRTRTVSREDLHEGLARVFGVSRERIIGEYGMCELSTPLWERVGDPSSGRRAERGFRAAPWVRVRLLDPETLEDAERGLVAIWDLANWQSSVGILTADLAHWNSEGNLVVEGRAAGAPEKGCSLAVS